MVKRNQKTIYWPPGREEALLAIAQREGLRGPNGEYSISAAIGWLIEQDERRAEIAAEAERRTKEVKDEVEAICKQFGIEDNDHE